MVKYIKPGSPEYAAKHRGGVSIVTGGMLTSQSKIASPRPRGLPQSALDQLDEDYEARGANRRPSIKTDK